MILKSYVIALACTLATAPAFAAGGAAPADSAITPTLAKKGPVCAGVYCPPPIPRPPICRSWPCPKAG